MDNSTSNVIPLGEKREIDGRVRVYYYGYWIKAYPVPADTLQTKKMLIEALTRRLFNHTEYGLNIPGVRLNEARTAYDTETDPAKRRVKGAMLAGALFNRATAIFTKMVEIQTLGVEIEHNNELMRDCGKCLKEALSLAKLVVHRSGEEGIDELWGEPLKAFSFPIGDFFESRYIKIAQTMRDIDKLCDTIVSMIGELLAFTGAVPLICDLSRRAKIKSETLATDPEIFDIWSEFVVAIEKIQAFRPTLPENASPELLHEIERGRQLILRGALLISDITRARVPMPKSTHDYVEQCCAYRNGCLHFGASILGAARSNQG